MATTRTTDPAGGPGELRGRTARTPAVAGPDSSRNLWALSPEECLVLLEAGGVGRVGLMSAGGIVMLPVNYAVAAKTVIFRTGPDTLLAAHANALVSFEADHLDGAAREGWSVLVQGHAHKVVGEDEVRRLERATLLEPWAGGARDVWVRITPARITGRRIRQS